MTTDCSLFKTNDAMAPWANHRPLYGKAITPNFFNCSELIDRIKYVICDIISEVDYNSFHFATQFIDYYLEERGKDPQLNSSAIFQHFRPDSKNEVVRFRGGSCVGKAYEVVRRLMQMSITSFIATQVDRGSPARHVAVYAPCLDGGLFIEVERKIPVIPLINSIVFTKSFPGLNLSLKVVEDGLLIRNIPTVIKTEEYVPKPNPKKDGYAEFALLPDLDPDLSVMKRFLLGFSFSVYAPLPNDRGVEINVLEGKVTTVQSGTRTPYSFGEFNPSDDFLEPFKTSKQLLISQIEKITKNSSIFIELSAALMK